MSSIDARELCVRPRHILTVDVEDYFMVEAFARCVDRSTWPNWPSRVVDNTLRVLDLFDKYRTKATFFFVGWVAEKFPRLVQDVHSRGHELACHSYWHRTVYSMTPDEFRQDTRAAVRAIEDAAGVKIRGYRAPSWSITKNCLWALDILAEEGFTYDSSIYPIHHDLYGVPGGKRFPYDLHCQNGTRLKEYPPATVRVLGQSLPGAGGGYLRIFPLAYTHWVFRKFEKEYQERVIVYLHPWELDPEQPRIAAKLKSRLRHYTNLKKMEERLEALIIGYEFCSFQDAIHKEGVTNARQQAPSRLEQISNSKVAGGTKSPLTRPRLEEDQISSEPMRKTWIHPPQFLTYHAIEEPRSNSVYTVTPMRFEEHLRIAVELDKNKKHGSRNIGMTFDDGDVSNYQNAFPLLTKYSQKGIFFVVGSFIQTRPDYMTWAHLHELSDMGHEIQSHSWSHPLLTHCTDDKIQDELMRSKNVLEEKLGEPVDALSVPGGRWNDRVLRAAARAGYTRVYVSDPRVGSIRRQDVELHGRLTVKQDLWPDQLRRLLIGKGFYAASFRTRYELKELFRRVVGDGVYGRTWAVLSKQKESKVTTPAENSLLAKKQTS